MKISELKPGQTRVDIEVEVINIEQGIPIIKKVKH